MGLDPAENTRGEYTMWKGGKASRLTHERDQLAKELRPLLTRQGSVQETADIGGSLSSPNAGNM